MEKGESARYEQLLLFPQCFQKACFPGASKGVIVWEWVKIVVCKFFQFVSLKFGKGLTLRGTNKCKRTSVRKYDPQKAIMNFKVTLVQILYDYQSSGCPFCTVWFWSTLAAKSTKAVKGSFRLQYLIILYSSDLFHTYFNLHAQAKYWLIDWMVFNAIFNNISVILWWPVHLSMLSWSSFNHYSTQYSFQATGCFPT